MRTVESLVATQRLGGDRAVSAECSRIIDRHLARRLSPGEIAHLAPYAARLLARRRRPSPPARPTRGQRVNVGAQRVTVVAVGKVNALVRLDSGVVHRVHASHLAA